MRNVCLVCFGKNFAKKTLQLAVIADKIPSFILYKKSCVTCKKHLVYSCVCWPRITQATSFTLTKLTFFSLLIQYTIVKFLQKQTKHTPFVVFYDIKNSKSYFHCFIVIFRNKYFSRECTISCICIVIIKWIKWSFRLLSEPLSVINIYKVQKMEILNYLIFSSEIKRKNVNFSMK